MSATWVRYRTSNGRFARKKSTRKTEKAARKGPSTVQRNYKTKAQIKAASSKSKKTRASKRSNAKKRKR